MTRGSYPSQLSDKLKAEKLVVVTATADGFRAAVSALLSLDRKNGVSINTYSPPEDHCARLLVKNLSRRMPESVMLEELGALYIHVQGVMQIRSDLRDQDPVKKSSHPHFIVSMTRGPKHSKVRVLTELCDL